MCVSGEVFSKRCMTREAKRPRVRSDTIGISTRILRVGPFRGPEPRDTGTRCRGVPDHDAQHSYRNRDRGLRVASRDSAFSDQFSLTSRRVGQIAAFRQWRLKSLRRDEASVLLTFWREFSRAGLISVGYTRFGLSLRFCRCWRLSSDWGRPCSGSSEASALAPRSGALTLGA